jgi:hypothetical protein
MKKLIQIVDRAVAQNPDKPKLHILMFYDQKWQELDGALTTFISTAEKSEDWHQIPAAPTVDVPDAPGGTSELPHV